VFYAFHAAAFDVYWKPAFVFDLTCSTFVLASFLAYVRGSMIGSLILFWIALKSKESAILFPLVLLAFELLASGLKTPARKSHAWIRLIPFLALALLLGAQALFANRRHDDPYTLRFTLETLRLTVPFYARWLLLIPYAGFAILAVPFIFRQARVRFGLVMFLL